MDSVIFEGVEYVKASVLAKRFRYTADYIGQLCRANKVDARLIGRSWFVSVESLVEHRENKYQNEVSSKPAPSDKPKKIKLGRKVIPSVIHNKTLKSVSGWSDKLRTSDPGKRRLPVSYQPDDANLWPEVIKTPDRLRKPTRVESDDSRSLDVDLLEKKSTTFKPTKLPEIYLEGELKVTEFKDADKPIYSDMSLGIETSLDEIPKDKAIISDKPVSSLDLNQAREKTIAGLLATEKKSQLLLSLKRDTNSPPAKVLTKRRTSLKLATGNEVARPVPGVPLRISSSEGAVDAQFFDAESEEESPAHSVTFSLLYWMVFILLTVTIGVAVLATGTVWLVSDAGMSTKLIFDFSIFSDIFGIVKFW